MGKDSALNLRSSPSGAAITVDGTPFQLKTPALISPLPAGEHYIKLAHAGYHDWERSVLLKPGEPLTLDVRMEPTETGRFSISSVPFQCRIFVDGRQVPLVTPATLSDLPVGTHNILLRREGYEDWSQAIVVRKDRHLRIMASLKPARGLTGHLQIQSYPPGADIILDGYPTGNRTPATLYNLQAGTHRLRLEKAGQRDWDEDVVVREGETEALLLTLGRIEPRRAGSATITSSPSGALVILDDVVLHQRTPVTLKSVTQGSHRLTIEMEGYQPWEGDLTVHPGKRTNRSVNLRPR